MPSPTIIAHKLTENGFAVITAYFANSTFEYAVQSYITGKNNSTSLKYSTIWTNDLDAFNTFDVIS